MSAYQVRLRLSRRVNHNRFTVTAAVASFQLIAGQVTGRNAAPVNMVLNMSSILLILFILSPVSQAIWENLYQHQKGKKIFCFCVPFKADKTENNNKIILHRSNTAAPIKAAIVDGS